MAQDVKQVFVAKTVPSFVMFLFTPHHLLHGYIHYSRFLIK
jgi:hypothetical protein